ncbi:unnamed protein product, partial [Mesorhabditis belari]|uniref:Uncharacterized protein n=1 Tax=Mesorhabditis belari TaxID=2138241 RepID=A0AAF3EH32_9BILA
MDKNRTLIANRHGLAGLHFLYGNLDEAFEVYKQAWDILLDTKRINEKLGLASNSIEDLFTVEELDLDRNENEGAVEEAEERDAMNAERVHRAGREGRRMPRAERSRKNDEEQSFMILTDDLDKETLLNTRCASCRIGRRIRDLRELLGGTRDASLQTDSRFSFELLCAHLFRIAIRVPMSQATSTKFNQMYDDFCAWISQIRPFFEASLSAVQAVQELAHKLVELENASKRIEEGMEIFVPRAYGGTLEMKTVVNKKKDNAIGRIDRFGQTKPTTVHHFVVQNSIEEEIYRITQNHLFEEGWTVQTLKDVFGIQGIQ